METGAIARIMLSFNNCNQKYLGPNQSYQVLPTIVELEDQMSTFGLIVSNHTDASERVLNFKL
jgi:hypothetical protein